MFISDRVFSWRDHITGQDPNCNISGRNRSIDEEVEEDQVVIVVVVVAAAAAVEVVVSIVSLLLLTQDPNYDLRQLKPCWTAGLAGGGMHPTECCANSCCGHCSAVVRWWRCTAFTLTQSLNHASPSLWSSPGLSTAVRFSIAADASWTTTEIQHYTWLKLIHRWFNRLHTTTTSRPTTTSSSSSSSSSGSGSGSGSGSSNSSSISSSSSSSSSSTTTGTIAPHGPEKERSLLGGTHIS